MQGEEAGDMREEGWREPKMARRAGKGVRQVARGSSRVREQNHGKGYSARE